MLGPVTGFTFLNKTFVRTAVYNVVVTCLCIVYCQRRRIQGVTRLDAGISLDSAKQRLDMISGSSVIAQGKRLKFAPGVRIIGRQDGPPEYRSRVGTVVEYSGASLYKVKFDDNALKDYVLSQWLELK
jgi:hypothetical protein